MYSRSAVWFGTISIVLINFLASCQSDFGFVKNGVIPIGNHLYLVVTSNTNELIIGTSPPGALIPTEKTWKGKPRTEREIIRYDEQTGEITALSKMERPDSDTVVIVFRPKYVKVYEGDGDKLVHKHQRGTE